MNAGTGQGEQQGPEDGLRGRAAIVASARPRTTKWGRATEPEFKMAVDAIQAACKDAGIDPQRIDGFASYSDDRNTSTRLASALNLPDLRLSSMAVGRRRRRLAAGRSENAAMAAGGGRTPSASWSSGPWPRASSAASARPAAAVRALGRPGLQRALRPDLAGPDVPARRVMRFLEETGVSPDTQTGGRPWPGLPPRPAEPQGGDARPTAVAPADYDAQPLDRRSRSGCSTAARRMTPPPRCRPRRRPGAGP